MMHPRLRYLPSRFDDVEDQEMYIPNGFHPISINDLLNNGRYKILHKLGSGGSSTVWLALDQLQERSTSASGLLVTVKILTAELSSKYKFENPEIIISGRLNELLRCTTSDIINLNNVQVIEDYFIEKGPNGEHLCLVYQLAGPSVQSMSRCPGTGRVSGSRRLRADLARKVAKQVVTVVQLMHSAGLVHGDLTPSNVLFQVSDCVSKWSVEQVYSNFGLPRTEKMEHCDSSPMGLSAPRELVEHLNIKRLCDLSLLQEKIVVIDFGQAFDARSHPKDYLPATALHYFPPESHFEEIYCTASDIWELACLIFEIRAGSPLFEPFFSNSNGILRQMVEMLGKLPEPWWDAFDCHQLWFEENGEPKPEEIQEENGILLTASKTSIREELQHIGREDSAPESDEGPMIESTGMLLEEEEESLLCDLLEKMLKYRPEDRITIEEVLQHPWLGYTSVA